MSWQEYTKKRVKLIKDIKDSHICNVCHGVNVPLTFHHRNPKHKEFSIGRDCYKKGMGKIKREIEKCDLVCEECHREIHKKGNCNKYRKNRQGYLLRTWIFDVGNFGVINNNESFEAKS